MLYSKNCINLKLIKAVCIIFIAKYRSIFFNKKYIYNTTQFSSL